MLPTGSAREVLLQTDHQQQAGHRNGAVGEAVGLRQPVVQGVAMHSTVEPSPVQALNTQVPQPGGAGAPPHLAPASLPVARVELPPPGEDWHDGMCSPGKNPLMCCVSMWCPCVMMYILAEKAAPFEIFGLRIEKKHAILLAMASLVALHFGAVPFFIVMLIVAIGVRKRYNIGEDVIVLCLKSWFCSCCYMVQMYNHAEFNQPTNGMEMPTVVEGIAIVQPVEHTQFANAP